MVADPRFSSALQTMTGMPDPLAPRTARAVEQPKPRETPLDRAYREREQTTRALGNATAQLAEFEGMQQAQQAKTAAETAKGEFDLAEQRAKAIEAPELRAERTQLRESIPKAFVPTQDNATDMATLFSLIGVIGFAVGAGGKGNAMAAMSAMNGMAQGYQQGRMDLYAKEKDKFETNVKALKTRIDAINDELEDVMQTAAVSYDKGLAKLKMVATKNDADFIAKYADKYGLPKAVEYLKSLDKGARDLVDRLEKDQARADERERDRLFRAEQQRIMQEDRQDFALKLKNLEFSFRKEIEQGRQEGKVGLKPGDKKTEGYVADNQLLSDVRFMKQQLQDPELQQLVKQYRVEGFLSEEGGKAVSQLLSTEMPPKLRKFLTSVRDVRNNYYLTISGKAVTGGEALRNYGTVPQPGDSPDVMVDKMDALEQRVKKKIEFTRTLYPSLPPLQNVLEPLQPTNLRPNEDYSRETTQNYYLNNRKIVPRGNIWVYEDDGTEAK